jgi:alkaline phosphatase D
MKRSTRRELVAAGAATALTAAMPQAWAGRRGRARLGPGAFRDGVASGEPGFTAVTFWSRLSTERPRSGARLVVARDEDMRHVVATAVVPTGRGIDQTLKTRIAGLEPSTEYFYLWQSANNVSPIGRTRTRPPRDSAAPLRIAFSSCQQYSAGYFSAHAHAATEELDLYLFLGDYIYERSRRSAGTVRADSRDATDLRSYRRKYRICRRDEGLRELHRVHPALHIWDDHEVANNYSNSLPVPAPLQRIAGYRAASEWIPRVVYRRDRHRIYKRIALGTTADLFLLDTRQYRTGTGDGQARSILGGAQMQWLIAGLKASRAQWKLIAQQVSVSANPFGTGEALDAWDGYPADRALLLSEIERLGIANVVFLSGDAHHFACSLLASDFTALGDGTVRPAAVEYVGGSVTSPGRIVAEADIQAESPWVRQYNGRDHGYALVTVDSAQLVVEYRRSDLRSPSGVTQAFERFTQPAGVNGNTRQTLAPSV